MNAPGLVKVVLCSTNPAKVAACEAVCKRLFPSGCLVLTKELKGLVDQPIGYAETQKCALLRARHAVDDNCDYGVGLEGGVSHDGWLINCVAVVSKSGKENHAWGLSFPLPQDAATRILLNKEEMGPVMDDIFSKHGSSKSVGGAIGQLTNGLVSRADMWETPLTCGFIPFMHPKLYPNL